MKQSTLSNKYVCKNCLIYIKDGRVPKIAFCRGLTFPEISPELSNMTMIEQRLVSPRHEFMNIRSLGRERQHGLHGMVVDVLIYIDKTVDQFPRKFLESQTIQLQLFRKLSFAKPCLYETIRPNVVLAAARYLSTTELFKLEMVVVSEDWVNSVTRTGSGNFNFIVNPNNEPCDIVIDEEEKDSETVPGIKELFDNLEELFKEVDDWDETKDDSPINPGSLHTLLLSNDNLLMKLAPGEGRTPLYFSQDMFIEEVAYPCVFAGLKRDLPEDLSILKKPKSDILRLVILFYYTYNVNLLL